MKIYNYVKIDIDSGKVVEEDSFDYEGPLALCGGGGASGQLSFPKPDDIHAYPKTANDYYSEWLEKIDDDIMDAITTGISPYTNKTPVDAGTYLDNAFSKAGSADSDASKFNASSSWLTYAENAKGKVRDSDYFLSDLIDTILTKVATDVQTQMANTVTITHSSIEAMLTNAFSKATTDVGSLITNAFSSVDTLAKSDEVDSAVDAYDEASKKELFGAYSRLGASMADIGAVNSSAFFMGMAMLERDHVRQVSQYRAELMLKSITEFFNAYIQSYAAEVSKYIASGIEVQRAVINTFGTYLQVTDRSKTMALSSAGTVLNGVLGEKGVKLRGAAIESEVGRVRYLAEQQEYDKAIEYDAKDSTWVIDLIQMGGNVLASSGGASTIPGHMSKEQSTISGAFSGAAMGAEVGAKSGNAYVEIGAIAIGAIAGGYAGYQQ